MRETRVLVSWESFCAVFRQEYTPESYFNNHEREFDNLKQGNLKVAEYARQFSSLLAYVPHVASQERMKRNKFIKGLRPELFQLVLAGAPSMYAETVNQAVDIEESLLDASTQVPTTVGRGYLPAPEGTHSSQSP
ncbi:hypothetical protein F511_31735 [Dorcoceras hygrometricum]|uniref:Retrotransposon gag domain-containing protein n=1 Tax=Dorcoceras hygrometricum TaxID=472368 RepID=A0A2Z7BFT6_9LAMI|nr:hypothetical protein F511_31735 [Dorcoceras hygrometricum]